MILLYLFPSLCKFMACLPRFIHMGIGRGRHIGGKSQVCPHSAVNVCTAISCCQILADDILWSIGEKKKPSLLFPRSVSAACILNNIPICAALLLPCSHTARENEQMQSAVSPSCNVQLFVCPRICINAILITFLRSLSADKARSPGTAAVGLFGDFIFPLVIFFLNRRRS